MPAKGTLGLQQALAACRAGNTLAVTKLDCLARLTPYARDFIEDVVTTRNIELHLGRSIHDSTDPVGNLRFKVLAMAAEFESDLIRARTREGIQSAKAKGNLRGKQSKLSKAQESTSERPITEASTPLRKSPNCSGSPGVGCTASSSGRFRSDV